MCTRDDPEGLDSYSYDADNQDLAEGKGTPPSNTVPSHCNNDLLFHLLRSGIDSVYLSYQGEIDVDMNRRLSTLKELAQSEDPHDSTQSQIVLNDLLFEVKGKGSQFYPYVLVNDYYRIQVRGLNAKRVPLAYVQVKSHYLTAVGVEVATETLTSIITELGVIDGSATISRLDVFIDFASDVLMDSWTSKAWITRTKDRRLFYSQNHCTGWMIAAGSPLSARLYNKTLEIESSGKDYLKPEWQSQGWQEGQTVWRLEFQFKVPILKELVNKQFSLLNARSVDVVTQSLGYLWRYATDTWLRLSIPSENDQTSSRWPTHPLWQAIQQVDCFSIEGAELVRIRSESRTPKESRLFSMGIGAVTSYMVINHIEDIDIGIQCFLLDAREHYDVWAAEMIKKQKKSENFNERVERLLCQKAKDFNILNEKTLDDAERTVQAAINHARFNDYLKAKDGE